MLTPEQADRLAANIIERERPVRPPRRRRPVFFMGLWCRACPDLRLLDPVQAKDLVREALIEMDQKAGYRHIAWMGPLIGAAGSFLAKHPWWIVLVVAGLAGSFGWHFWHTRQGVLRRLQQALAEARASAQV
jgi:hypothetical protein